jgi:hypothetical protein
MRRILIALLALGAFAQQPVKPETVVVTCQAKPGEEAKLARVLQRHWTTARDLKLVLDSPHLTLRRSEAGGKVTFVEILTWRDAAIPDNAPDQIRSIWSEMRQLSESIDIAEVTVEPGEPPAAR